MGTTDIRGLTFCLKQGIGGVARPAALDAKALQVLTGVPLHVSALYSACMRPVERLVVLLYIFVVVRYNIVMTSRILETEGQR